MDSWLTLVSRLSNSETLMDSPHSLPQTSTATGFVPFYPINFLVTTQKVHIYSLYIIILARASEKMRCWLVRKCCFVCSNDEIRIYTTWLSLLVYSDTLYILVHFLPLFPDLFLAPPLTVPFLPFCFLIPCLLIFFFSLSAFLLPSPFFPSFLPTMVLTYTYVHVYIYLYRSSCTYVPTCLPFICITLTISLDSLTITAKQCI